MAVVVELNRVERAAARYRDGFLRDPGAAADMETDGSLVFGLQDGQAWAFREWTARAREANVLSDAEVATVEGALDEGRWSPAADLALRCAVVQLMAELNGGGA